MKIASFGILRELELAQKWEPDGIIAHVHSLDVLRRLQNRFSVPIVNTSAILTNVELPSVYPDNQAVGRLAAELFLSRGYHNFAFVGDASLAYARQRVEGFKNALPNKVGLSIYKGRLPRKIDIERNTATDATQAFGRWLRSLPPQTGVLTASDPFGIVTVLCMKKQDMDILGNFGLISGHDMNLPMVPTITSVDVNEESWGRESARMLMRLLPEEITGTDVVLVKPKGIIERETTAKTATKDTKVQEAVQYIREHAAEEISVQDVVDALEIGRRTIEERFKRALGHTILTEIQRTTVHHAKHLLLDSKMTVQEISRELGMQDVNRLIRLFKAREGMTPGAFRKKYA